MIISIPIPLTGYGMNDKEGTNPRLSECHIAKMPHIRYVGSGYSGHWEVDTNEEG